LNSSGLKRATEGFLCAPQDQALKTTLYAKKVLHEDVDSTCRLCHAMRHWTIYLVVVKY